jgi:hypothetical protein
MGEMLVNAYLAEKHALQDKIKTGAYELMTEISDYFYMFKDRKYIPMVQGKS